MKLRGLYAITPEEPGMLEKVRQALEGGVALLQYRRKRRDLQEAREIAALARRYGVPLIVNDDVELALELGAQGVHLGRDDGDLGLARRRLPGRILGASCYNDAELARRAIEAGADYVAFGSDVLALLFENALDLVDGVEIEDQRMRSRLRRNAGGARVAERERAGACLDEQRVGVAVVAAFELDYEAAPGEAAGEPDRGHGGLGAR